MNLSITRVIFINIADLRFEENKEGRLHHFTARFHVKLRKENYHLKERLSTFFRKTRLRLLKIGAQVIQTARRVWFRLASGYPWKNIFGLVQRRLSADTG